MAIHEPGRRLMHFVPLKFVQKRVSGGGGRSVAAALNLTSMIDFLFMVVVFLLMTFSASGEIPLDKNVKLPAGTVIGHDLEQDRRRGFTVTEQGVVVLPKADIAEQISPPR